MSFNINDYDRYFFYGGEHSEVPEVRLLKSVIAQAIVDATQDSDKELQKEAREFLNSDDYKFYCKVLEGVYLI